MYRTTGQVAIILLAAYAAVTANAAGGETPRAAVDTFFEAMKTNQWALAEAVMYDDAVLAGYRLEDGQVVRSKLAASDYLDRMNGQSDRLLERIWDVEVLQQGRLATVWTPYDFFLNEEFHHCGTNSFSLIREDDGWRIAGWRQVIRYTEGNAKLPPNATAAPAGLATVGTGLLDNLTSSRAAFTYLSLLAAAVWLLVRLLLLIVRRIRRMSAQNSKQRKIKLRRDRAFRYLSRFVTGVLMALAVLGTFYARSDVFLLALSILVIVGIALGLRQILPRFYAEIKLLLDFGSVRDSERILYEGVPMQVREMNTFAILANPMLKGFIRLPLSDLADRNSHPAAGDAWFPTKQDDYVMLSDGGFAQVVDQSVDTVVLRQMGALRHLRTADFFAGAPSNLSTDGFVVPVTFGIAYRHQAISQSEVPQKIREAIEKMIENADWHEHCTGIIVEFKEAAANSLDYLIVIKMASDAAGSYFGIGRAVQRSLVALCNEQDWEIPFAQLTVHQAQE